MDDLERIARGYGRVTAIAVLLAIVGGGAVFANGFKILGVKGAKASAMGEAFIVQADDPSAVSFNPAGLVQLEGTRISLESTLANAWPERKSPSGATHGMKEKWQYIPSFYVVSDLKTDRFALGLGVTVPNGLSSEWKDTSEVRYVNTYSSLTIIDTNPCFACRVNDNFSVGLGLSYYTSEATLESMVDFGLLTGAPGADDGKRRLSGKGDAWGFNIGLLYAFNPRHSAALTYKSGYEIDYSGDLTLSGIPAAVQAMLGTGPSYRTDIEAGFTFPDVVVLGYAFRPSNKLKLELNLDWTNWDRFDSVDVEVETPLAPLLGPTITSEYDLESTVAYKLGVEYALSERLAVRGGYIYNENATPEETWRPSLPDSTAHFITTGIGYRAGSFRVDGALQVVLLEEREIDNNVDGNEGTPAMPIPYSTVDGKYENIEVCYSVSLSYEF